MNQLYFQELEPDVSKFFEHKLCRDYEIVSSLGRHQGIIKEAYSWHVARCREPATLAAIYTRNPLIESQGRITTMLKIYVSGIEHLTELLREANKEFPQIPLHPDFIVDNNCRAKKDLLEQINEELKQINEELSLSRRELPTIPKNQGYLWGEKFRK